MSEPSGTEGNVSQAREREKKYDWLGAAESYKRALSLASEQNLSKLSEIYERLGYASYQSAMQAENTNEFRDRMGQAVGSYEKAKVSYERLSESGSTPQMLRSDAMIAYIGYWLASEAPEKRRLINECWRLTKESLRAFEKAGDSWEYGKTYNQLSSIAIFAFTLESGFQAREKTMREAAEHGERAIRFLSNFGDSFELARAYAKTVVCFGVLACYFVDPDEKERLYQRGLGDWRKAKELSEEAAFLELLYPVFGGQIFFGLEGTEEALANFKKASEYAKKTRDKFFVGCALDWLVYHTVWKGATIEDPDEKVRLFKAALQYAEDSRQQFSPISFVSPRGDLAWAGEPHADYYGALADLETNLTRRRELLEKGLEVAPDLLRQAENSGYPEIIMYAHGMFRSILLRLAKIETDSEEKKRLLEKALEQGKESKRMADQIEPFMYWNRGIEQNGVANIKSELADLAKDNETKKSTLQEAVQDKESGLSLCIKDAAFLEKKGSISILASLGRIQFEYGNFLNRLYEITSDEEHLGKATGAFADAAESFKKLGLMSRMAECYWKTAQTCDNLGEYLEAAENFDLASSNYKKASEKIPQLKDFYQDHALYMQSWSEIEKARHHHRKQEYGSAEEHFEKAADLHKSLKQWSYLAPNYFAWGQVEHGEDLSRKEQSEEAIQAFKQAVRLFEETKELLKKELGKIENLDEKQMAVNMAKATDLRQEYCLARIAIEEAKILDKKATILQAQSNTVRQPKPWRK